MFNYSRRKQSTTGILDSGEKKGKQLVVKSTLSRFNAKFGIPVIALFCATFFLAGFFSSNFLSQEHGYRPISRVLVSVRDRSEKNETGLLQNGGNGDGDDDEEIFFGVPSKIISWYPRAVYFPEFASEAQCRHIIEISRSKLTPSILAFRKGETPENTKGIRTSSGMFISASEDKTGILDIIEEKIERVTTIPRTHYEDFNVLRYEIGQLYKAHYDAFNPSEYGPQKSQRVATFLLYLSNVEEGGDTMFPYQNGSNMDGNYDYTECIGLRVKPRQGDGLLFYSLFPNGTIDPTSLHGSCPVVKGEKWVATKWIRDQEIDE